MLRKALLIFCSSLLLTALCSADEVKFATSSTLGCFTSTSCAPTSSNASTTDLSFVGSSFGQPNGIATTNGNLSLVLGQFTLTDSATTLIDKDFYSTITFTLPVAITGGQSSSAFSAEVLGVVVKDAAGLVYIDFNNAPQHFTFTNGSYSGSFDFSVNSLLFGTWGYGQTSQTVNWYGQVTNAVQNPNAKVPEPSSLVLLSPFVLLFPGRRWMVRLASKLAAR